MIELLLCNSLEAEGEKLFQSVPSSKNMYSARREGNCNHVGTEGPAQRKLLSPRSSEHGVVSALVALFLVQ